MKHPKMTCLRDTPIGEQSIHLWPRPARGGEIERGEEGERRKNWRVSSCHTQTMMVMTETEEREAERGREGGVRERSPARSPIAVYGLRQIVVAFVGIATAAAAAPAALLSEIRRVIARLRLHLPANAPSPGDGGVYVIPSFTPMRARLPMPPSHVSKHNSPFHALQFGF